jgi:hypothetical protein
LRENQVTERLQGFLDWQKIEKRRRREMFIDSDPTLESKPRQG